jgi:CRISPR-associated protein Csm5
MEYKIETVSPIHIGNGNSYSALDSVFTDTYFYAIDMDALFRRLQGIGIEKIEKLTADIESGRSLSENIKGIIEPKDVKRYTIKLSMQNRNDRKHIRGVQEFIKDANNGVYLPGSEIKGAIRTAILYRLLLDEANYDQLKKALINVKQRESRTIGDAKKGDRRAKRQLGKVLRNVAKEVENLLRGKKDDAKYDLLKFIQIGDSSTYNPHNLEILHINSFGSRGKHAYVEALPKGAEFSGYFNITKNLWLLGELGLGNRAFLLSEEEVLESCYGLSADLLKNEIEYYRNHHEHQIADFYQQLQEENTNKNPLIRIGQGQGFLSTTITLAVKNNDPELYEEVRLGTRGRSYPYVFPKTRRLVFEDGKPMYPLGWVKIKIGD